MHTFWFNILYFTFLCGFEQDTGIGPIVIVKINGTSSSAFQLTLNDEEQLTNKITRIILIGHLIDLLFNRIKFMNDNYNNIF